MVNHLVYDAFGKLTSESNPAVDSLFLFTARPFDADTGLQNNLNRWYDPAVGRWLSEDPVGFAGSDRNLYRYVGNSGTSRTDPLGEQAGNQAGITGPCHINLFAGHAGPDAERFRDEHAVPNREIVTGCGNYVGLLTCWSAEYEADIPRDSRIPGWRPPVNGVPARATLQWLGELLRSARAFQRCLCANRQRFCDDGRHERYACGAANQRCDSVTISLTCDDAMRRLMTQGIGPDGTRVRGLPNQFSSTICDTREVLDCRTYDPRRR